MFKIIKKYNYNIIDKKWNVLKCNLNFDVKPNINEIIYIENDKKYYKILNIIHYLNKSINILVEELNE